MTKFMLNIYRQIFARKIFAKFNRMLFQVSLRGLGIKNYENDLVSGENYLTEKILPMMVKSRHPVLFDVGANIGKYTKALQKNFPTAVIYAFEPHPANFSVLKESVFSDKTKIYNLAMGKASGQLSLYDRADRNGSTHASLHEEVISEIHKKKVVKVEVTVDTLDDFAKRKNINHIDFLKIDTEGNELAVLQGAINLLDAGKIGCIHFEFNSMNIVSRVFFRDFRVILKEYELYRLLPSGLLHLGEVPLETELFAYQNILALPK